ncbi:exocyst complex component EXO84C-like isoform X2 [Papaver somniferum]|uniref:exocyst complex component EXO84C-like isoform X2 n=1 Tax=Papaver somniferum TaxID=3469 RepID=UPI000E704A41|nr:exocyst complex component EXO84C-like isoform X2 [Papaver somniferum]
MESSEEEDDFPTHEWITPQSKINSIYQSNAEKGIRKLCCELLDLKDAVENLCGNMHTKYQAFLRISEEVGEMEHELIELQKHVSAQGILVQDLMTGVCRELEEWNQDNSETLQAEEDAQGNEHQDLLVNEVDYHKMTFLENVDVLLAEHKVDEALDALDAEERSSPELNGSGDASSTYKSAFIKRKLMLEDQLIEIAEQPSLGVKELKLALSGLLKLGKGSSAHQLLLKAYGSRLHKSIEGFLPSCSIYPETFSVTLSKLVFSTILLTAKESGLLFGDNPVYTNKIVQWAECELESFVRLVKENSPPSEMVSALRAVSICVQASLSHCSLLESKDLKLSKLLTVLLHPYVEEVLELNFQRARRMVLDITENNKTFSLSPRFASPLSAVAVSSSDSELLDSGTRFMYIVNDIVEQLTPAAIDQYGGNILNRISQLFDKYVDALMKSLPGPSEDDNLIEHKEVLTFRAETDAQQLALLGTAFTVADELLPMAVSKIWTGKSEAKEPGSGSSENIVFTTSSSIDFKEWRRHLQHSLDKLRDHFCLQYVLNFIYAREDRIRLDARIYVKMQGEDLWETYPLPSLPFQALFSKFQQLATVAGDVLLGKEKIQKILLSRLTETVVMWLSDEQEFWDVFKDETHPLQPLGLQQLILDMHFIVEIAVFGGYPSRHVHQIASAIIARAIKAFSDRGIDPQSELPPDEWFANTAKTALNKLILGTSSASEVSDIDEHIDEHIIIHDDILSDSDDTASCPSSIASSSDSFASAHMGESESPTFLSDSES